MQTKCSCFTNRNVFVELSFVIIFAESIIRNLKNVVIKEVYVRKIKNNTYVIKKTLGYKLVFMMIQCKMSQNLLHFRDSSSPFTDVYCRNRNYVWHPRRSWITQHANLSLSLPLFSTLDRARLNRDLPVTSFANSFSWAWNRFSSNWIFLKDGAANAVIVAPPLG